MKGNNRILALMVLGLFVFMFAFAAAQAVDDGKAGMGGTLSADNTPGWLFGLVQFFGLGETWGQVIAAIAVLLIVFAAAYDIVGFTAIETPWVRYVIAIGIALIAAVSRGIIIASNWLLDLVAGSVILAVVIALVIAVVFFVVGGWFKGLRKVRKARAQAKIAEAGYTLASTAKVGNVKEAQDVAKAVGAT